MHSNQDTRTSYPIRNRQEPERRSEQGHRNHNDPRRNYQNYSYYPNSWGSSQANNAYSYPTQANTSYYSQEYRPPGQNYQYYNQGYQGDQYYRGDPQERGYQTYRGNEARNYQRTTAYHQRQDYTAGQGWNGSQWPEAQQRYQKPMTYYPGQETGAKIREIRQNVGKNLWNNREPHNQQPWHRNTGSGKVQSNSNTVPSSKEVEDDDSLSSHNSSSFDSEYNMGEPRVGRYGKQDKPKKKKKNQEPKGVPPQPKAKQPSLVEEAAKDCYLTVAEEEVQFSTCPFNPEHIMPAKRLQTHIDRCKQKCENAKYYRMCPYNPCHYFRYDQIEAHVLVCKDKSKFDLDDDWDNLAFQEQRQVPIQEPEIRNTSFVSTKPASSCVRSESEKRTFENLLIDDF